jgi:anti-sigma B factor antagonist
VGANGLAGHRGYPGARCLVSSAVDSGYDDDGVPGRLSLLTEVAERLAQIGEVAPGALAVVGVWHRHEDVSVIVLAGEIDLGNARGLAGQLPSGRSRLVIDLSHVTFIDSSGIYELLQLSRRLAALGGQVVLAAPTESVARVFDIVKIGERVRVASSLEAALAHVEDLDQTA